MKIHKKKSLLEYNLHINNVNGILQALSLNLVVPFASIYAKRLNATDYDIALLNSYPAIFCLISVFFGTYLFRKFQNKKKLTSIFFIIGRSFFIVFIFIKFFPPSLRPILFVLLYGAMNFPNSIANMGWQSFMGDLFKDTWRGRAFSKRNSISTICSFIITLITGNLLFYLPKTNEQRLELYQVFFGLAFIIGLIEVYSFNKHQLDTNSKQIEKITSFSNEPILVRIKNIIKLVYSNRVFLDFCLCAVFFHFSWQMGWPLFFTYEVDVLHSNEFWTSIINSVSFISQALAFIVWQTLSEKKGNNFVIFLATLSMAFCPFFYMIAKNIYYVVIFTTITGSAAAGTVLLLSNNLYESAPDKNRTVYIAFYTVLTNITLMIAPIVGMKLKNVFNIYIALLIVGLLRLASSCTFYYRYKKYKSYK